LQVEIDPFWRIFPTVLLEDPNSMKILKRTSHTLESLTVDMRKAISMKVHINNGEPLIYQQEDLNAFSQFHRLRSLGLAVLYGEEEYPNHTCDLLGWNEDEERVQFSSTMVS